MCFIASTIRLKMKLLKIFSLRPVGKMKAAPFDKSGIYFIEFNNAQEMEEKLKC